MLERRVKKMAVALTISALLAIIVGIIIMIWPKIINYAIGIWLILYGVLQMLEGFMV